MIPLAFIVTELFTNCLKHGVVDGRGTCIDISVNLKKDALLITVKDDGGGFTEQQFMNNKSLGSTLVMLFTKQLNASISISDSRPTAISIEMPLTTEMPPLKSHLEP